MPASRPRVAVVGHVEWVRFARVPRVPWAGDIVHALEVFEEPCGGRRRRRCAAGPPGWCRSARHCGWRRRSRPPLGGAPARARRRRVGRAARCSHPHCRDLGGRLWWSAPSPPSGRVWSLWGTTRLCRGALWVRWTLFTSPPGTSARCVPRARHVFWWPPLARRTPLGTASRGTLLVPSWRGRGRARGRGPARVVRPSWSCSPPARAGGTLPAPLRRPPARGSRCPVARLAAWSTPTAAGTHPLPRGSPLAWVRASRPRTRSLWRRAAARCASLAAALYERQLTL